MFRVRVMIEVRIRIRARDRVRVKDPWGRTREALGPGAKIHPHSYSLKL